ncbi:antitoxin (DNA-binding transcriptional repressor) of toxin-antitoxin stability system [Kineosphaera limosa]|uniref:Prevent-host-death family protein n=1 Tax=Kineosphaera limosa NBRC 100340 TaxID=1184609 RepID=K6VIK0_9MICO|nr:hypothetical protein [Kineosphaera limosa]NYE02415.1 antitoxin (DNA-binding transcriptional repressor) of toxin-antitoxin stability system [Kineosphaera limosa]GAB96058.1 hypothetical protein KILIM_031_00300 [Kineosphaera limosa NBRC 100340]
MGTITKRELNQRTAAVLALVTDADELVITERGTPRWRITTFRDQEATLARLEREGRYAPPSTTPTPWPMEPGGPAYTEAEADALLAEMRGEH